MYLMLNGTDLIDSQERFLSPFSLLSTGGRVLSEGQVELIAPFTTCVRLERMSVSSWNLLRLRGMGAQEMEDGTPITFDRHVLCHET